MFEYFCLSSLHHHTKTSYTMNASLITKEILILSEEQVRAILSQYHINEMLYFLILLDLLFAILSYLKGIKYRENKIS